MTMVLVILLGLLLGLLVTPRGRAVLARAAADVDHALGFRPAAVPARARPPLVADPADRRARAVEDAYVAGEFGYDELEWRILLALVPPPPGPSALERNWALAQKAAAERMQQPVLVGGDGAIVAFPSHSTPWTAAVPSTESVPWSAAPQPGHVYVRNQDGGPHCRYHELHSGSGYLATVCDCGHDMAMHYNGGCNDCDAVRRSQFPRPQMQEIGKPPEAPLPTDADPRLVDHRHW